MDRDVHNETTSGWLKPRPPVSAVSSLDLAKRFFFAGISGGVAASIGIYFLPFTMETQEAEAKAEVKPQLQ